MSISIELIENQLIDAAQQLGNIADTNCHYTHGLAKQIERTGKSVDELTIAELKTLDITYTQAFNHRQNDNQINQTEDKHSISLDDHLKKQAQQLGFKYLLLESELLLKRVKDGGHSGEFLAHAFISCYRTHKPFQHSLGEIMKLDTEAIRLFHEILHIRFIKGWSDDVLYNLEQEIIKLNEIAS